MDPLWRKHQDWRRLKRGVFCPSQHDRPQHFPQALQGMLWVGHLLHPSDVLLKGCLRVEGVVLEEPKIREELDDMVLDWRATESPPVLGLHTLQICLTQRAIHDKCPWNPIETIYGQTARCRQPLCITPLSSACIPVIGRRPSQMTEGVH